MEFPNTINVSDLDTISADFIHIVNSQDTESIREYGYDAENEYDSYFVLVGDGDYIAVYGMYGGIPYNHKVLYLLTV